MVVDKDEIAEVISEATDKTAASEACHHIGIPSQIICVGSRTELVVTAPRSSEVPAWVGEKYNTV